MLKIHSATRCVRFFRSYPVVSAGSLLAAVSILAAAAVWSSTSSERAAAARARSLVAALGADAELTAEEYITWKQISVSEPEIRLEVARLFQENRYAALLFESSELIGNAVIGRDPDGRMSRELAERLICRKLESDPGSSNQAALLYLVPWTNPVGLDSAYCASVLSANLLSANPDTLSARAALLSRVLPRLPKEQSAPHVAAIVDLMATAGAADMDLLFSALQDVDSARFPDEFRRAAETLTLRTATAASLAEVSDLFDSLDYLKMKIEPARLIPVIDAALDRTLLENDVDLKYGVYSTLLDLKVSHPETRFGARADYLMRGLHRFGNDIEIEDYSGVLRLDEQYGVDPGSKAELGSALLESIRTLTEEEYVGNIKAYCKRFLELSPELQYEIVQRGAKLLFEQLRNEAFIFQRECLHDPVLVARLEPSDRDELTAVVVSVLEEASQSGASGSLRRVADLVELLGLLPAELGESQINRLKVAIATALERGPDAFGLTDLAIAAVRADLDLPPDFYIELFAMFTGATSTPPMGLSILLEALPAVRRSQLVEAELHDFFTLTDPVDVASRVPALRVISAWIAPDEQARVSESLVVAIDETQDMSIVRTLATLLASTKFQVFQHPSEHVAVKQAIFRKIAASAEQSDLAALFGAARALRLARVADAEDKAILRAATARFLGQLDPPDGHDASVRGVIKDFDLSLSSSEVEQLSARFIRALDDDLVPIANYADSIQTLSLQALPGELDALLLALHAKLTSTTHMDDYPLLLSTWLAVEGSTKRNLPPEQRVPLYNDLLRLPLMSRERQGLLQKRIDEIASGQ